MVVFNWFLLDPMTCAHRGQQRETIERWSFNLWSFKVFNTKGKWADFPQEVSHSRSTALCKPRPAPGGVAMLLLLLLFHAAAALHLGQQLETKDKPTALLPIYTLEKDTKDNVSCAQWQSQETTQDRAGCGSEEEMRRFEPGMYFAKVASDPN